MINRYLPVFLFLLAVLQLPNELISQTNKIVTVDGTIDVSELGFTLSHEHIMSNFGKDINQTSLYNESELFGQVVPYLKELRALGVNSIIDCTAAYFGRRVDLLRAFADSTGIQIVTNTGIYGAAADKYIPAYAFRASPGRIAKKWIKEYRRGIEGTDIKPGFIKLAFDAGEPSPIDSKLFEAGILTHLKTGLPIAVHTGDNVEAVQLQLRLLEKHHVGPHAWIWVHANKMKDNELLIMAAKSGAWISLDGVNDENYLEYVDRLSTFRSLDLLDRILLSHDGNGFPGGKEIRKFDAIMRHLIPALLYGGFTEEEIKQLLVQNPGNAFAIRF